MVAIDPDNARAAAAHLRVKADVAGELDADVRWAARLSELDTSSELVACAEIDEELRLLASILESRAAEAAGFHLPGSGWPRTSILLGSLLDHRGSRAAMSGPLALLLLMEQGRAAAVDGSNPITNADPIDDLVFTVEGLQALANDPDSSPELSAAAAFLASRPDLVEITRAWEGTGAHLPSHSVGEIPLRDIDAFLQRNDVLSRLLGPDGIVAPNDLFTEIDDDTLAAAGVDPDHFDDLALPRNGHDLLVSAIDHGTFTHSPQVARRFVQTLPIAYIDGQSIDIRSTSSSSIQQLYDAATLDLDSGQDDFMLRNIVTAFLPETTSGVRNQLITSSYADSANWHNARINGAMPADDPAYGGNNWFHLGVAASNAVRPVIRGEQRALEVFGHPLFAAPAAVAQDIADGNQAIYHHFTTAQAQYWRGEPLPSPRLTSAFALLDEAAGTSDAVESQYLLAESTTLFAIEEQIIVDDFLQLDGLGIIERVGTQFLTHAMFDRRSAAQVMTDEAELRIEIDGRDLAPRIDIGQRVPVPTHPNNHVDPAVLEARLPDDFDWGLERADDWSDLDQRLPIIVDVTIHTLTEPALVEMADHHRRGTLATPR